MSNYTRHGSAKIILNKNFLKSNRRIVAIIPGCCTGKIDQATAVPAIWGGRECFLARVAWRNESLGSFHGARPPFLKKENGRALMQARLPTDVFWRAEASWLATTIATMVYPFRKVSLVARSRALSFVRDSRPKRRSRAFGNEAR